MKTVLRNLGAIIVGIVIYLLVDTIAGIILGLIMDSSRRFIGTHTVYGYIIHRVLVCWIVVSAISIVVNYIGERNSKGFSVSLFIVGVIIIITGLILTVLTYINNCIIWKDIVFLVTNSLVGVGLFIVAKEEY